MANNIVVKMPNGGDEKIAPGSIFVLRDALTFEKDESPEVLSCIWGASFRMYPAEPLIAIVDKLYTLKLSRLTSPDGLPLIVSVERCTDRDEPCKDSDHDSTRSVLKFGPGALSPRVRGRETKDELTLIWQRLGLPLDILN